MFSRLHRWSDLSALLLCALLTVLSFSAAPARAEAASLQTNTVSLAVGLPVPLGGFASLELLHRFDERNFIMVGGGTAMLLWGVYLSYGRRLSPGLGSAWFFFAGVDTDYFIPFGGEHIVLPGGHVGIGKEWFPGACRLALSLNTGFPWVGGLRFSVGL